jgi:hypothetical protein
METFTTYKTILSGGNVPEFQGKSILRIKHMCGVLRLRRKTIRKSKLRKGVRLREDPAVRFRDG